MIDIFWYYMSTLLFLTLVIGLYSLNRWFLSAYILKRSAEFDEKMRNHTNRMSKFRQDYAEFAHEPSDVVGSALGELGVDGIMKELGIDPSILTGLMKNPLAKGLIERYAPRVIEQLSKGVKNGGKNNISEIELL